jgi:hypothetical protein
MKQTKYSPQNVSDFNVKQRTSDGMFNATELLKQWNEKMDKQIIHFSENSNTKRIHRSLDFRGKLSERNSMMKSKAKQSVNAGT